MSNSNKPWKFSAKVLIYDKDGQCLLLKRSLKSKGNPGRWEPPGGKIDPGESFDGALIREVGEETGLDVSLLHAVGVAESELTEINVVHLMFEAILNTGQVQLSDEHIDYMWVKPEDFKNLDLVEWFKQFKEGYRKKQ
jgi:8-oxo-dGTP diphosphatase